MDFHINMGGSRLLTLLSQMRSTFGMLAIYITYLALWDAGHCGYYESEGIVLWVAQ